MARTRMLKPELRTSEKVARWPREVRYFWALLWGYLDDYGKGKDNVRLILADCFPLDDDLTADTIDEWLWTFAADGVVVRYTVDGADFLAATNWSEHQKPQHPTPSKCPDQSAGEPRMRSSRKATEGLRPSLVKSGFSSVGGDLSPFCAEHPAGISAACKACGNARRAYDAAQLAIKNRPTPGPPSKKDLCPEHPDLGYRRTQCPMH